MSIEVDKSDLLPASSIAGRNEYGVLTTMNTSIQDQDDADDTPVIQDKDDAGD